MKPSNKPPLTAAEIIRTYIVLKHLEDSNQNVSDKAPHGCDKKSKYSIKIYVVRLFVCEENFGSNYYAVGNGWDKVEKLGFFVNIARISTCLKEQTNTQANRELQPKRRWSWAVGSGEF